jgi:large subunit ribosomal protein L28
MARVCQYSGKRTRSGRTYTTRGLAKSKGGVGKKTTGKTNRMFKANVQKVRAVINGRTVRVKIAAKFLRRGLVEKPKPRRWHAEAEPTKA